MLGSTSINQHLDSVVLVMGKKRRKQKKPGNPGRRPKSPRDRARDSSNQQARQQGKGQRKEGPGSGYTTCLFLPLILIRRSNVFGVTGLQNVGNTCFFNSVLQVCSSVNVILLSYRIYHRPLLCAITLLHQMRCARIALLLPMYALLKVLFQK